MPAKTKIMKQLTAAYLVRDTPSGGAVTTLTGNAASGQPVVAVTSATGIAIGDVLRIGTGEELELGKVLSIAALNITLVDNLVNNHIAGENVVEQTVYDLGDVTGDGANIAWAGSQNDVSVSTRRVVFTQLIGYVSAQATLSVPTMTIFNIIAALGIPLANVVGTGTPTSPFHLATDGNEFNTDINQSLILMSVLGDGTVMREELWGVDADYTGLAITLNRGSPTMVPMKFVASAGGVVVSGVANPYTPVTTYRPSKTRVFDALTEVGLFADATVGPLATTTTAVAAAGASALLLTAVTNLVPGDWIKVGVGENVEFHQVDTIVSLTANLRTRLLRAQAIGVAVVREQQVAFSGIHEDGVAMNFGGNMDPIRIATRRLQAGLRPGLTTFGASFKVIDIILSNIARALGIPQSAILGGNRLPFNNNIGTASQIDGAYLIGMTQDGGTFRVNFWGCSTDITNIAHTLTNSGSNPLPMGLKPTSGIQFLQYL